MRIPDPAARYEIQLVVPFHDLDPLHMVWHGNYFKYFDMARFGLFESRGVDLYRYHRTAGCIFPITRTETKFILPLRHRDHFICRATLMEARYKIVIDFEIRLFTDRTLCARARSEQVAVKTPEMELLLEIPADLREALLC